MATMNPSHEYAGTKGLNHALASRFDYMKIEALTGSLLVTALSTHVPTAKPSDVAEVAALIESLDAMRRAMSITTRVSIRQGVSALNAVQDGVKLSDAVRLAFFDRMEPEERVEIKKHGKTDPEKYKPTTYKGLASYGSVEEMLGALEKASSVEAELKEAVKKLAKTAKLQELVKVLQGQIEAGD